MFCVSLIFRCVCVCVCVLNANPTLASVSPDKAGIRVELPKQSPQEMFICHLTGELGRNCSRLHWKAGLSRPSQTKSERAARGSESGDFSGAPIYLFEIYFRGWGDGVGEGDAAPMRGSGVITIMRMDVFIMGCVSRSTSFTFWLTWVAPSASYIRRTRPSSWHRSLAVTGSLKRKVCVCVCACSSHLHHLKPLHLWGWGRG